MGVLIVQGLSMMIMELKHWIVENQIENKKYEYEVNWVDALPFTKEAYAHIETAALSYDILFYKPRVS